MFSKYRLIELTFGYFNFNLDYSWFFNLQFNRYKLLLFIWFIILTLLLLGFLDIIFVSLIVELFVHIYRISVHWSWKLSSFLIENCVGHIQTRNIYLPPPQVCGRSSQGCWLCVWTCLLQLIDFFGVKHLSSSSFKPYFVDCWLVCIIFIGSAFIDPETCTWVWLQTVSGLYLNWTYRFASPAGLCKSMLRLLGFLLSPVAINTLIDFKAVPQVWQFWVYCWQLIYKHQKILFFMLGL